MSSEVKEQILIDEWRGLYRESWKGVIVDEAFAHPAKFSRALVHKIYEHVIGEGWAKSGDHVIDPFGGVALGAFPAMQHGLVWYGCELEEKFVTLGNQNIALWNERYSRMPNWGEARLLQGDSRSLRNVLREASCCVSSPPYGCDSLHRAANAEREEALPAADRMGKSAWGGGYGTSEGQLSDLPATTEGHRLAITSPPYTNDTVNDRNGIDQAKIKKPGGRNSQSRKMSSYGEASGQLGNLAVSSPPFPQPYKGGGGINVKGYKGAGMSENEDPNIGKRHYQGKGGDRSDGNLETLDLAGLEAAISSPPYEATDTKPTNLGTDKPSRANGDGAGRNKGDYLYGQSGGQLGTERGETFWSASRLILEQLHQVITPGGHAVFVVKAFVRDKKIVDFPAQWAQLCEAVGFKLLHDHHALLKEEYGKQDTMTGEGERPQRTVERKSFFRRLAESKGSPRIDHENALCFERQ